MNTRSTLLGLITLAAVGCEAQLGLGEVGALAQALRAAPGGVYQEVEFDSYEVVPETQLLNLRGRTYPGATVTLYRLGSGCSEELDSQVADDAGQFMFTGVGASFEARASGAGVEQVCRAHRYIFDEAIDFNLPPEKPTGVFAEPLPNPIENNVLLVFDATDWIHSLYVFDNPYCQGEPVHQSLEVGVDNGLHYVAFHLEETIYTSYLTVQTERYGKLSPCSDVFEYHPSGEPPTEVTPAVGGVYAEPGTIYGYQIPGQAPPRATVRFYDQPDCSGRDLTRIVSKFNTGAFTATIDLPPDSHLESLGFQVTDREQTSCITVPVSISTTDQDILRFWPIERARQDDASLDVRLNGTARGLSLQVFLGDSCSGDTFAETEVSTSLPFGWDLSFPWHEWMSHVISFRLTGGRTSDGIEQRCIVKPGFLDPPFDDRLPPPTSRIQTDRGDTLEFFVGFADLPSEPYYVNISYHEDCSNPIFRGAIRANYHVTLPAPIPALFAYTESEDYRRSSCIKVY